MTEAEGHIARVRENIGFTCYALAGEFTEGGRARRLYGGFPRGPLRSLEADRMLGYSCFSSIDNTGESPDASSEPAIPAVHMGRPEEGVSALARTKSLSRQIREAREVKGFSVAQLADRLGVSQVSVYYWESGRVRPRDTNLAALGKTLKIPVWESLGVTEHGGAISHSDRIASLSGGDTTTTMRTANIAPFNQSGGRTTAPTDKSVSAANMDALLARLEKGISAEHSAMDNLLKRMAAAVPER